MNITIKVTKNYGVQTFYPVCDKAKLFARIAGTKTLTPATIKLIKELGYEVNIKHDEVTI